MGLAHLCIYNLLYTQMGRGAITYVRGGSLAGTYGEHGVDSFPRFLFL